METVLTHTEEDEETRHHRWVLVFLLTDNRIRPSPDESVPDCGLIGFGLIIKCNISNFVTVKCESPGLLSVPGDHVFHQPESGWRQRAFVMANFRKHWKLKRQTIKSGGKFTGWWRGWMCWQINKSRDNWSKTQDVMSEWEMVLKCSRVDHRFTFSHVCLLLPWATVWHQYVNKSKHCKYCSHHIKMIQI